MHSGEPPGAVAWRKCVLSPASNGGRMGVASAFSLRPVVCENLMGGAHRADKRPPGSLCVGILAGGRAIAPAAGPPGPGELALDRQAPIDPYQNPGDGLLDRLPDLAVVGDLALDLRLGAADPLHPGPGCHGQGAELGVHGGEEPSQAYRGQELPLEDLREVPLELGLGDQGPVEASIIRLQFESAAGMPPDSRTSPPAPTSPPGPA